MQELVTSNSRQFLIIGIGVNIVSSPKIDVEHKTTNIFLETKKKPTTKEIIKHNLRFKCSGGTDNIDLYFKDIEQRYWHSS